MGYTVPTTRIDEEFIDEDDWEVDLKDNMDYLKTELDKMNDCVQTQSDLVAFQAGTKFLIVTVRAEAVGGTGYVYAMTDAADPPTTVVALVHVVDDTAFINKLSFSFMVQPTHYYKITGVGSIDVAKVTIWEFH